MSFDFSQFKGIHKVTKAPERVWVGRWWSIEVPVGFTYTVDPEKAGGGGAGTYQLHIQKSSDCNFDTSYSSVFNVVVYGHMEGIDRNCDDMSSETMLQSLDDLPSHFLGQYQIHKRTRDLLVLHKVVNESQEYTAYEFQVITRGCNLVFTGQFNCHDGTVPGRKKAILHWLDTIEVPTQSERLQFSDYSGTSKSTLPKQYSKKTASIDPGIEISIPVGFHAETNPLIIGASRKLVIVPENYSFSADPMEAPVALSVQSSVMNGVPTRADLLNKLFEFYCDHGMPFEKNSVIGMYKNSDKAFAISQIFSDNSFSKALSLLFADDKVYIIHLIINYSVLNYDRTIATWDADHLAMAWLARIHVRGETVPDYPSRKTAPVASKRLFVDVIAAPSHDLYPHYDQLGNTSVPQTSPGMLIVTNAGGTEFESYPVSGWGGDLKDIADRVINLDSSPGEFKRLVSKAVNYAALFRVDSAVFNPKEDRECDIRNLRMRRAYQLHALRSFAWTLAEQARLNRQPLSAFTADDYQPILAHIEQRKFLNYKSSSHFPTLCGTADLHVCFVPDETSAVDKATLGKNELLFGNMIPNTVASLDGLRKDLLALSDLMEKLFQWLLNTRDYSKPLDGTAADVLYAWCAMVLSAETAFFIEDGPMACLYSRCEDPAMPSIYTEKRTQFPKAGRSSSKDRDYSSAPIIQSKRPRQSSDPKDFVIENGVLKKYNGVSTIMVIPEGVTSIDEDFYICNRSELEEVYFPDSLQSIPEFSFSTTAKLKYIDFRNGVHEIEANSFFGSAIEEIRIPGSVKKIDSWAFSNCERLKHLVIEDGVESIGEWAFHASPIDEVFIPASVHEIGSNAFSPDTLIRKVKGTFDNCIIQGNNSKSTKKAARNESLNAQKKNGSDASALYADFPVAELEPAWRRLLDRKPKRKDSPHRFDLVLKPSSGDPYYYDAIRQFHPEQYVDDGFADTLDALLNAADKMVSLFRADEAESDRESELRGSLIRKAYTLHAFKSFIWTSVEHCKAIKEEIQEFSLDQSLALAQFIYDHGGANWKPCAKSSPRVGAPLLKKAEKEYEYTSYDLPSLVKTLYTFEPIMRLAYEHLSKISGTMTEAERTLTEVLAGWCVFSLACYYGAFTVKSGPEDLIPAKQRELPKVEITVVNEYFYVTQNNTCFACRVPGDSIEFPEGIERVLIPWPRNIHGDTVESIAQDSFYHAKRIVFPSSFRGQDSATGEFVIIPEIPLCVEEVVFKGVYDVIHSYWEDVDYAGSDNKWPHAIERVVFQGSVKKLHEYAFSNLKNLHEVILPDGLEEIGSNCFLGTPSLEQIYIPSTVETIGRDAFGAGWRSIVSGGKPKTLIVEKSSLAEKAVKQFLIDRKDLRCKVVLSSEEQARVDEENHLKHVAVVLQEKLTLLYRDSLDENQHEPLKREVASEIERACDRQTWRKIREKRITPIPMANLEETNKRLASVSPEESYDLLPEWIANEYIRAAEEKRALAAFEEKTRELKLLATQSVLPLFERELKKDEILGQIASRAKAVIGDGTLINTGLAKYSYNAALETLRFTLARKPFDSAESLLDAILEKKSTELDRLTDLQEEKNSGLAAIEKEKAELEEERSHLGLFHGKRKKEIAALLEAIPERIRQVEKEYEEAKETI